MPGADLLSVMETGNPRSRCSMVSFCESFLPDLWMAVFSHGRVRAREKEKVQVPWRKSANANSGLFWWLSGEEPAGTAGDPWVRSLGGEDPLQREIATHSGTLARVIPWTQGPGRLQSMRSQRVGHNRVTNPKGLTLMTSAKPDYLWKARSPNTITLGLRGFNINEFGEDTIQSVSLSEEQIG